MAKFVTLVVLMSLAVVALSSEVEDDSKQQEDRSQSDYYNLVENRVRDDDRRRLIAENLRNRFGDRHESIVMLRPRVLVGEDARRLEDAPPNAPILVPRFRLRRPSPAFVALMTRRMQTPVRAQTQLVQKKIF